MTEADTCSEFGTPRLVEAGWAVAPHAIGEQRSFTNGRVIVAGGDVRRGQQKRADYLLFYRRDYLRSHLPQIVFKWSQDGSNHPRFDERELLNLPVPRALFIALAKPSTRRRSVRW